MRDKQVVVLLENYQKSVILSSINEPVNFIDFEKEGEVYLCAGFEPHNILKGDYKVLEDDSELSSYYTVRYYYEDGRLKSNESIPFEKLRSVINPELVINLGVYNLNIIDALPRFNIFPYSDMEFIPNESPLIYVEDELTFSFMGRVYLIDKSILDIPLFKTNLLNLADYIVEEI